MTKRHAAIQLLKHGPLTSTEFREITGWTEKSSRNVLHALRLDGKVQTARCARGQTMHTLYVNPWLQLGAA